MKLSGFNISFLATVVNQNGGIFRGAAPEPLPKGVLPLETYTLGFLRDVSLKPGFGAEPQANHYASSCAAFAAFSSSIFFVSFSMFMLRMTPNITTATSIGTQPSAALIVLMAAVG